jgi:hypothetical protein
MAARSVKVQFETEEMPNTKLVLVGSGLSHGEWSSGLQPPESLPPGFAIEWQSESDGFLTGTQVGFVIAPLPRAATHQQTRLLKTPSTSRGITRTAGAIRTRPYSISGGSVLDYNADNEMAGFTLSLPASSRVVTHRRHLPISPQNDLLFATSSNGTDWNNSKPVTGQQSPYTPAVTVLGGELYIAKTRAWKTLSNLALVKLSLGPLAVQRIDDTADQIGLKQAFGGERPA